MWILELEVEKWTTDKVVEWAQKQRDMLPEDVEVLKRNRVTGNSLLTLTEEKLRQDGLPRGPAVSLALAIESLKLTREQVFGEYQTHT